MYIITLLFILCIDQPYKLLWLHKFFVSYIMEIRIKRSLLWVWRIIIVSVYDTAPITGYPINNLVGHIRNHKQQQEPLEKSAFRICKQICFVYIAANKGRLLPFASHFDFFNHGHSLHSYLFGCQEALQEAQADQVFRSKLSRGSSRARAVRIHKLISI